MNECRNCRFFRGRFSRDGIPPHGWCYRYPPKTFRCEDFDGRYEHERPMVQPDDFCGEFQSKRNPAASPDAYVPNNK